MSERLSRRDILTQLALMASGSIAARLVKAGAMTERIEREASTVLTGSQREMITQLAELIIPETDTPGAIKAGVPGFIEQIVSAWYTAEERAIFMDGLAELDRYCVDRFSHGFCVCRADEQIAAMQVFDQRSVAYRENSSNPSMGIQDDPDIHSPFFFKLKELTVLGYYTSALGATVELSYNPIPMRYDGDVNFDTLGRQWSS